MSQTVNTGGDLRTIGNLLYVPWCLAGLARVEVAQGEWERAAPLPPCHPDGYARTLVSVRVALGEAGFATAHATGERLSADEALAAAVLGPDGGAG